MKDRKKMESLNTLNPGTSHQIYVDSTIRPLEPPTEEEKILLFWAGLTPEERMEWKTLTNKQKQERLCVKFELEIRCHMDIYGNFYDEDTCITNEWRYWKRGSRNCMDPFSCDEELDPYLAKEIQRLTERKKS